MASKAAKILYATILPENHTTIKTNDKTMKTTSAFDTLSSTAGGDILKINVCPDEVFRTLATNTHTGL